MNSKTGVKRTLKNRFSRVLLYILYIFRCNNVLYVRGVEEEDEEGEMKD